VPEQLTFPLAPEAAPMLANFVAASSAEVV
jgi:hypothetical protein